MLEQFIKIPDSFRDPDQNVDKGLPSSEGTTDTWIFVPAVVGFTTVLEGFCNFYIEAIIIGKDNLRISSSIDNSYDAKQLVENTSRYFELLKQGRISP